LSLKNTNSDQERRDEQHGDNCYDERQHGFVGVPLDIIRWNDSLRMQLEGPPFFDLGAAPAALHAASDTEFYVDSRYETRLVFTPTADGKASAVTVNPGRWAERGERISE
jgi:hypothetical protein